MGAGEYFMVFYVNKVLNKYCDILTSDQLTHLLTVCSGADVHTFNPVHRNGRKHKGKMADEDFTS